MELLKKQSSENGMDKQNSTFERINIENTPFTAIKLADEDWFGAFGSYRITKAFETFDELEEDLNIINWNRIINIMKLVQKIEEENE